MESEKSDKFSLFVFRFSAAALLAILVSAASHMGMPPFGYINSAVDHGRDLIAELSQKRPDLLIESRYYIEGVRKHEESRSMKGVNILQGVFAEGTEVRLIDMNGEELHSWDVDFFRAFPDPDHLYPKRIIPRSPLHVHTQGAHVHKDGRVLALMGNYGAVMLDKCSRVLWTLDRLAHHSVTRVPEGYWIPAQRDVRKIPDELLLYDPKARSRVSREALAKAIFQEDYGTYEDLLLLVDDHGKVIKEISVLRGLVEGDFTDDLYDAMQIRPHDPTHVNDIEVVTEPLARKITGVKEGDLLVSIRQLHMLAIFDQDTGSVKWHQKGPWVRQHDPDITANGNITVYNNDMLYPPGGGTGNSNIMEIDPASGEVTTIVPPENKSVEFYTSIMGNHQLLPNGNRLIVESRAGRVLEVDPAGNMVWIYVDKYDDKYASLIEFAERYPLDYFEVEDWSCPER